MEARNGDIGIRAATCGSFPPEPCFDHASHEACAPPLCLGPRDALDHHSLLSCPAGQWHRNCDLAPALLLGRDGQRLDDSAFSTADSFLKKIGADGLRLRAARPEWVEPGTAL